MNVRMICCAAALALPACTQVNDPPVATAQVEGAQHVIVRAEYGRIWWENRAWTAPHELWTLPATGEVQNLAVTRENDGFLVTFNQGGTAFRGSFGEHRAGAGKPADHASELARSDR